MSKKNVTISLQLEIPTNAETEEDAIIEAQKYELPEEYIKHTFEVIEVTDDKDL